MNEPEEFLVSLNQCQIYTKEALEIHNLVTPKAGITCHENTTYVWEPVHWYYL